MVEFSIIKYFKNKLSRNTFDSTKVFNSEQFEVKCSTTEYLIISFRLVLIKSVSIYTQSMFNMSIVQST